jgi:hypothetical protein
MPSSKTSLASVLTVPDGADYKFYCGLIANGTRPASRVTPVTIVGPATAPAAGASVSVTITDITPGIPILAGQWLELIDPTGATGSVLAQVVTTFTTGTTLVLNMPEAPADDFEAIFPAFVDLSTDLGQTRSVGVNSVTTFDHRRAGTRQTSRGDVDNSYSVGGSFSDYSAGQLTLNYAFGNSQDVYIERHRSNPDASTFDGNPPIEWGVGIVNAFAISPADGNATYTSGVAINGELGEVAAAAAP